MGSSSSDVEAWAAAQLREKLEGKIPVERQVLQEAGLLDQEVIAFLVEFEHYYERPSKEYPAHAHETDKYRRIVKKNASKNLRRAMESGDTETLHHFLGVVSQETNISGIQFYERFRSWVNRTAGVTYLAGNMGTGKTDLALLMAEIWQEANPHGEVASNITSCPETLTIETQEDLEDWLEADEDDIQDKLFIFDEASSHASGYSKDAATVQQQFAVLVNKIRKHDGQLIIIGHSGKDVHPHIRRLADYMEKDSKKEAAVFEEVTEGDGEQQKFELDAIPPTSWQFDTKESSSWEWKEKQDPDTPEMLEVACQTYNRADGALTQKDVADITGVSASQISQHYEEYQDPAAA